MPSEHHEHEILHLLQKMDERLNQIERHFVALFDALTQAVNDQATAVTALTASVDAAVTELQSLPPTDAQIAALTSTVTGLTTAIQAQTARLTSAVTPPPPAPTGG